MNKRKNVNRIEESKIKSHESVEELIKYLDSDDLGNGCPKIIVAR